MAFLQKNVNVFLMILVLFVAAALAGSSAYYQDTFKKINTKFESTATNLSTCETDLTSYQSNLQKTIQTLNTTSQDIRKYDELYSAKATELSSTQDVLNDTSAKLKTAQIDLTEAEALKDKYKRDFEKQVTENADLREQNSLLSAQNTQLQSESLSYSSRLSAANNCISTFVQDYTNILDPGVIDDIDSCEK